MRIPLVVVALAGALAADAGAQVCYQGRPAPACKVFFLTESGVTFSPGMRDDPLFAWAADVELGAMVNTGPRSAVGGSAFVRAFARSWTDDLDNLPGLGLRFRYRRWLGPTLSADAGSGLVLAADANEGPWQPPRLWLSFQVALNAGDWAALTVEYDHVRQPPSAVPCGADLRIPCPRWRSDRVRNRVGAGVRLGYMPGGFVVLLAGVLLGARTVLTPDFSFF